MAPSTLSFRSTADLDEFEEVQINGETIDPSNYTLTEGSTIVTLSIDYLKTLDANKHEITVVSKSGAPTARFEVVEPKVNEHGFYYNQPYTGYVESWGKNVAFFIREDGTLDTITSASNSSVCTYTLNGNLATIVTQYNGTMTAMISTDGTEMYCNELSTNFVLGDEYALADEEYIYIYDSSLGGYTVSTIDNTKAVYASIKNNIKNYPTVMLGMYMYKGNINLMSVKIPNSVETIGREAFYGCSRLTSIVFDGTVDEWNTIIKKNDWNYMVPATEVKCSDGTVAL